jgi:hypothetical protein
MDTCDNCDLPFDPPWDRFVITHEVAQDSVTLKEFCSWGCLRMGLDQKVAS